MLFAILCSATLTIGIESALHFTGPAIDGPFQLYNALRRIAAGQHVGADFQFFHGALVPYVHYPFFRLFGGGFFASEVTRQALSALLYPTTVLVVLKAFLGDWRRALAWGSAVMALSIGLRMTSVIIAVNSLLGVRSTLPVLMAVVFYRPQRSTRTRLAPLTLGGAFALGTEQGIALAAALIVVTAVVAWREADRRSWIRESAWMLGGAVVTLLVIEVVLGGPRGALAALNYNFRLVPMDQYWYFGAPPNPFVAGWGSLLTLLATRPRISISLALGIVGAMLLLVRVARATDDVARHRMAALALLLAYGCISAASLLGSWEPVYVQPLLRVLLLVGAVLVADWFALRASKMPTVTVQTARRGETVAVLACVALMFSLVPPIMGTLTVTLPHVVSAHLVKREPGVLGGLWPEALAKAQAVVDANRAADGRLPTLWSTYAGLLEARNGTFNPTTDYVIHALGPSARIKYVEDFMRLEPQLVQTVSPAYTPYEWWIESTSWDIYSLLLREYDVTGSTPWSLFWKRRASADSTPGVRWGALLPDTASSVVMPPIPMDDSIALVDVEIEYRVHNPLHVLPIVGSMPRYLVTPVNVVPREPITLDPYTGLQHFPMLAVRGKAPQLRWATFGLLPGASISVTRVSAQVIPVSAANRVWLNALLASPTDH